MEFGGGSAGEWTNPAPNLYSERTADISTPASLTGVSGPKIPILSSEWRNLGGSLRTRRLGGYSIIPLYPTCISPSLPRRLAGRALIVRGPEQNDELPFYLPLLL